MCFFSRVCTTQVLGVLLFTSSMTESIIHSPMTIILVTTPYWLLTVSVFVSSSEKMCTFTMGYF